MELNANTCTNTDDDVLTIEKLEEAYKVFMAMIKKDEINALKSVAKEKGFDLDGGDKMFLPEGFAEKLNIEEGDHPNILISKYVDCSAVLMKKSILTFGA